VTKIRHHHKRSPGHSQHFQQKPLGISDLLQSLTEHRKIKAVIWDINKSFVQIGRECRQAAFNDSDNVGLFDFHSHDFAAHFVMQALHQPSVATSKVDHTTAAVDMTHDQFVGQLD